MIRSPISGVVVARNVELGQTVAASFNTPTLFQIARDLAQMQIDTSIAEADVGGIREGLPARFRVDAFPGQFFRGDGEAGAAQPHHPVQRGELHGHRERGQPEGKLKPGMTAFVQITANRREGVLRVPNAALRFRPPADPAQADKARAKSRRRREGRAPGGGGAARRRAAMPARASTSSSTASSWPCPCRSASPTPRCTEVAGRRRRRKATSSSRATSPGQGGPQSQVRLRMF